jgi:hypothetical protein
VLVVKKSSGMKFPETIRRHPYIYGSTAAFLLTVGGVEAVAYSSNPTYDRPDDSCVSPFATSKTFADKDTSTLWQTYTGINTSGVVIKGSLPDDAYGVEASFAAPGDNAHAELQDNVSDMLKTHSGNYALKLAIGSGDVQFAVRVVAPEGSKLCSEAPKAVFEHQNSAGYGDENGQLPWPNPVNAVVELF